MTNPGRYFERARMADRAVEVGAALISPVWARPNGWFSLELTGNRMLARGRLARRVRQPGRRAEEPSMTNLPKKRVVALERRRRELRALFTELEATTGDDRRDSFWRLMRLVRRG